LDGDLIRVQRVFCEVLEDDSLRLSAHDSDATLAGWDSFAHVKLIIGLEEEFGIKFSIDEVAETKTVEGLRKIIARKKPT
jgi:acyl carrier protein